MLVGHVNRVKCVEGSKNDTAILCVISDDIFMDWIVDKYSVNSGDLSLWHCPRKQETLSLII